MAVEEQKISGFGIDGYDNRAELTTSSPKAGIEVAEAAEKVDFREYVRESARRLLYASIAFVEKGEQLLDEKGNKQATAPRKSVKKFTDEDWQKVEEYALAIIDEKVEVDFVRRYLKHKQALIREGVIPATFEEIRKYRHQKGFRNRVTEAGDQEEICFDYEVEVEAFQAALQKIDRSDYYVSQDDDSVVRVDALETLDPEIATALGQMPYYPNVSLRGLTTISPDAAAALSACPCKHILMDGIIYLSPEAAKELSRLSGNLYLGGLDNLEPEVAAALVTNPGMINRLGLGGLRKLSPEALKSLLAPVSSIDLSHIAHLVTAENAPVIAVSSCAEIFFSDSKNTDPQLIELISAYKGKLNLSNQALMTPRLARIIARADFGEVDLSGIERMTGEEANILKEYHGVLNLRGLYVTKDDISLGNELAEYKCQTLIVSKGTDQVWGYHIRQKFLPPREVREEMSPREEEWDEIRRRHY